MGQQAATRRVTVDLESIDDQQCTILHVDMDAFFAAVELRRRPELRGQPMMVAGAEGRGVVLSATYEARAYGVRSAMPTGQAVARCPGITIIPPDHQAYRSASAALMELLGHVTPMVEPVSVDEAFLDVTGARRTGGRPAKIAVAIRERVRRDLGITATVGGASTKFIAKLASTLAKPDGLLLVPPAQVEEILRPLPVSALWGVGPQTTVRLVSLGLSTVGDIADCEPTMLARAIGPAAAASLYDLAHGRDARAVTPQTEEVSIGAEETFTHNISGPSDINKALLGIAAKAARRLRRAGRAGRTVVLKVRFSDFTTVTRSESLEISVDGDREVYEAAIRNWRRLGSGQRPIRLLGVRVENLIPAGTESEQLELGADPDRPGWRAAQQTLDALDDRFGAAAPRPATLLPPSVGSNTP